MAKPSGIPKFAYYTRSKFDALSAKDISTFYVVEETDGALELFLGKYSLTNKVSVEGEYITKDWVKNNTLKVQEVTQSQYDQLTTTQKEDPLIFYVITDAEINADFGTW